MNGISEVDGYRVQANIHASSKTQVARAVSRDGRPVILKMCQNPYPDDETIERFRREYAVLAHLGGRGAVSALALTRHQNAPVLVLADDAAVSLADWLEAGSHTVEEILAVAVEIARAMAEIHAAGVIHRHISPEHVLVHEGVGHASFIDFSLALQTGTDGDRRLSLDALMGAYWYLAPEATGRTERPVDERSDLYALGALFYRMLSGTPPFSSANPMEVIHAHLAVAPAPLTQGPCGPVPAMVASIVQRLLAKNPEDRYQRASGLLADLERCLSDLQLTGEVLSFTAGEQDRSLRLRLSRKVYGRDGEWQTVQRALRRVGDGAAEWIVLTGPEGIGKSALLREFEERVRDAGAHVGLATFVDDDPDGPLGALVRSLGGVIRSLLELPDRDVNHWRRRLSEVLGPAGPSLAGLVPHLAECLQINPMEAPTAAERRRSVLEDSLPKLVDGLAGAEAPLVLLVDDLQLADDASLTFLQRLFTDARAEYLLVLGTERTEDGPPAVGLEATLDEMRRHTVALTEVEISPLTVHDLQAFLADSLTMAPGLVSDLADVLQRKTAGNPFGARQLLELWQQRDLLRPDPGSSGWRWDSESLEQATGTDHGIRFLVERVAALPVDTQRLLGLAAVIGTEFDGRLLANLLDQPDETLLSLMAAPLEGGLLERVEGQASPGIGRFRFTHAAVRQTVLGEVSPETSTGAHLAIVRWLEDSLTEEGRASRAAELADHWNQAGLLASDSRERTRAAMANKMAGEAAEAAGRYAAALAYYEAGIGWLAEDCWERDVPLTSDLYFGQMRMLHTLNDRGPELEMAKMVAERSPRIEDKLHAAAVQIGCYTSQGDVARIVETGIAALGAVGIHVPRRVSRREAVAQYEVVKSLMAGRTREELLAVPTVEDPTIKEAMRVLTLMGNGAGSDRVWYGYLGLLVAEMSLRYGYNSASGSAFTTALAVLGIEQREVLAEAFELGRLGMEVSRRFDFVSEMNSLSAFSMQVNHWRRPLRESLEGVREFYAICRSNGRDGHLYLHSPTSVLLELACGMGLDAIRAEAEDSLGWVQDLQVAVAASLLGPLLDTLNA
ncbi:MAG: ATP-binding protein, partial [Clostridia bacterium]